MIEPCGAGWTLPGWRAAGHPERSWRNPGSECQHPGVGPPMLLGPLHRVRPYQLHVFCPPHDWRSPPGPHLGLRGGWLPPPSVWMAPHMALHLPDPGVPADVHPSRWGASLPDALRHPRRRSPALPWAHRASHLALRRRPLRDRLAPHLPGWNLQVRGVPLPPGLNCPGGRPGSSPRAFTDGRTSYNTQVFAHRGMPCSAPTPVGPRGTARTSATPTSMTGGFGDYEDLMAGVDHGCLEMGGGPPRPASSSWGWS